MTPHDRIIEEIRDARRLLSDESGHDPTKYIASLATYNAKYQRQVERGKAQRSRIRTANEQMLQTR